VLTETSRLEIADRPFVVGTDRIACQFIRQAHRGAVDQSNDLEACLSVIGERVALAHFAEADGKDPNSHRTTPKRDVSAGSG